jgi:hypothetical protein
MANPWFRMYGEFATDPKVQMLSETDQRRLTMLFCLRCNGHVTLHDEEVTFLLRISNDEWMASKALFVAKGFIDSDNEILNWDKRQFTSDTSKNRVAAYRERKKQSSNADVTLQKQKSNAIDTDTDTDTEHKKHITRKDKSLALPDWLSKEVWSEFKAMRTKIRKPLTPEAERLLFIDLEVIKKNGHDPIAAINNSIKNSWQGIFEPKQNLNTAKQKPSRMDISGIDYKAGINADGSF